MWETSAHIHKTEFPTKNVAIGILKTNKKEKKILVNQYSHVHTSLVCSATGRSKILPALTEVSLQRNGNTFI